MAFEIRERVRWSDVDLAGIICYGAYTRFLEVAETELFRAAGYPYGTLVERLGVWLPRVHMSLDFRQPAFLDDLLTVEAGVEKIGRRSIALGFTARRDPAPEVLMRGRLVFAAISRQGRRPVEVPSALAASLRGFLLSGPDRPSDPVEALVLDVNDLLDRRPGPSMAVNLVADAIHARLGPRSTCLAINAPLLVARRGPAATGVLGTHVVDIARGNALLGRIELEPSGPLPEGAASVVAAVASRLALFLPR